jgi:hypothetical protein
MTTEELIEQVKEGKAFQGKNELIRHYQGKRLTLAEAITAHCYECSGYWDNGAEDCGIPTCPLYPYAPYSDVKAPKKLYSDETKAKMRHRTITSKIEGSCTGTDAVENHPGMNRLTGIAGLRMED